MNYIYSRYTNWEEVVGIIIRGALTEDKATYIKPPKYLYQKILVFIWSLMMLVLISAYQDNLIALITKPSINIPFTSTDGMIEQNKMKWGLIDGGLLSGYAKSKDQGTTMRTMYDQVIMTHGNLGVNQSNIKELEIFKGSNPLWICSPCYLLTSQEVKASFSKPSVTHMPAWQLGGHS